MSDDPPTPPADLPTDLVNSLTDLSLERLRAVAGYAEALAEHKARTARLEEESGDGVDAKRPDDLPEGAPAKATITIKEINDNRYYYWQWREGKSVKSQYKRAVGGTAIDRPVARAVFFRVTMPSPDPHDDTSHDDEQFEKERFENVGALPPLHQSVTESGDQPRTARPVSGVGPALDVDGLVGVEADDVLGLGV